MTTDTELRERLDRLEQQLTELATQSRRSNDLFRSPADPAELLLPRSVGTDLLNPPDPWVYPAYIGTWTTFGAPYPAARAYKDLLGVVHVEGLVKNGAIGTGVIQLPQGMRPQTVQLMACFTSTGVGRFDIGTDGVIIAQAGGTGYFGLACSFATH